MIHSVRKQEFVVTPNQVKGLTYRAALHVSKAGGSVTAHFLVVDHHLLNINKRSLLAARTGLELKTNEFCTHPPSPLWRYILILRTHTARSLSRWASGEPLARRLLATKAQLPLMGQFAFPQPVGLHAVSIGKLQ